MKLTTLLEALNAPYDYHDEYTYDRHMKKFIFQSANGDYYHVILQHNLNLTHGVTLRVDFYNESVRAREEAKGDQGDVDTAGGTLGVGDAFRVFSTVVEIVREFVERAAPGTIVFKGRTDASRVKLYRRFAQSIGKVLPGYKFTKEMNDKEAGYDVITFMCKKIKAMTESHERLDEISRPSSRQEADRVLQAAGYHLLGQGAFGAVYEKPGAAYVLKVFTANDHAYRDFLTLAVAHKDNPHFPRFFGKVVKVTPDYHAVRMEKLTPFNPHTAGDAGYGIFDYIQDGAECWELRNDPQLRAACDLVRTKLLNRYWFDHKDGSFMMRGDTIVLTDPVLDIHEMERARQASAQAANAPVRRRRTIDDLDDDELLRQLTN